jgi:glycerol-3-phosphate acyltransferase PlsY
LVAAITGYLFGTIPSADIASRLAAGGETDLRTTGTGNPGAANAMKVLGTTWGYGILAADIGKGAAACGIGRRMAGDNGAHLAGVSAVVGHCFPVWNGFRGGKGVAASAGQCLATFPAYFPIDLAVAGLTSVSRTWRQRAFATTAVASAAWVFGGLVWWRRRWPNLWGPKPTAALPASAAATSVVILSKFWMAR